ncbi:hypothetical protein AXF42_Ash004632 [Apostasia shenzhenica]|uniref:Transcription repressor n=1 Tax=Apostasia shenzhenica TaxID=1088818 RepID=A0A2I0BH79_9ASPA|nr:hypothetical protein AXF42_Ash004632 [Apostasia shenzhenica]
MGMGSYRFKLSEMIPNLWFYKLRDMNNSGGRENRGNSGRGAQARRAAPRKTMDENPYPCRSPSPKQQTYSMNRSSYYIPSTERAENLLHSCPSVCARRNHCSLPGIPRHQFDSSGDYDLPPPVRTKPRKKDAEKPKFVGRSPTGGHRIKTRVSSPKLEKKRVQAARKKMDAERQRQKMWMESLVVVKSSSDPQKDFRESMVEMIVENDLRGSKDLEELLACYLSLNSDEYHEIIVKVFEQIWFDLIDIL